jgi:signal transduction histidine kinase
MQNNNENKTQTNNIDTVDLVEKINSITTDNNNQQLQSVLDEILQMLTEVTEQKKQIEKEKRLIEAGRAMLILSHSAKNILQMVGGAAEVIDFGLRTNEMHRVKRSWDILKPNMERLKKFVLDMLDYSKDRKLEIAQCQFNRIIQSSIESLKSQLKQKKLKLNIRVDQNIPTAKLDAERLHEMSLNLILNAIDIVDPDSGIVSIETKFIPDTKQIQFLVSDNGPGMTDEMKEKIFQPFESGKNKFGTGLGMPIAKQIIDQHNGSIDIKTTQGKGTTFTVTLPLTIHE